MFVLGRCYEDEAAHGGFRHGQWWVLACLCLSWAGAIAIVAENFVGWRGGRHEVGHVRWGSVDKYNVGEDRFCDVCFCAVDVAEDAVGGMEDGEGCLL